MFRKIGRAVTAPVRVVKSTTAFARFQKAAYDVWRLFEQAARDPSLYRSPTWLTAVLKETAELYATLPLAEETRQMLKGWKTYLVAAAGFAVGGAQMMGWLTPEQAQQILVLLGASGLATMRAAVAKAEQK
jgi:hypothetical protein